MTNGKANAVVSCDGSAGVLAAPSLVWVGDACDLSHTIRVRSIATERWCQLSVEPTVYVQL